MKIILYIVWALFVVAAVFAVVHAVRKTRHEEQLVASWPKVQATVTGSVAGWTNGGQDSTWSYGVATRGPEGMQALATNLTGTHKGAECSWV
ncbi:MAG: hypothetical protein ACLGIS_10460, partial [Actinomycetes bacterium]